MGPAPAGTSGGDPGHRLRVAVAASTTIDVVPEGLLHWLADGVKAATVLLRRGINTRPGKFESLVAEWCRMYNHLDYRWILPDPADGPAMVFNRDTELVSAADVVIAFLTPAGLEGGTGHVVERAIDRGVPVYSFTIGEDLQRLGENDPTESWEDTIREWLG